MSEELDALSIYRAEELTPETFFPTARLNHVFRLFMAEYRRVIDGVRVTSIHYRPQLEIMVKIGGQVRTVALKLSCNPNNITINASTLLGDKKCMGVMQVILFFMGNLDYPSLHLDVNDDLTAQFHTEIPTTAICNPGDFYALIVRLAETASKLEQMST